MYNFNLTVILSHFFSILCRRDVLQEIVNMQNYEGMFLPVALRQFFKRVYPPDERGDFLDTLLNKFAVQFCATNPSTSFTPGKSNAHSMLLLVDNF